MRKEEGRWREGEREKVHFWLKVLSMIADHRMCLFLCVPSGMRAFSMLSQCLFAAVLQLRPALCSSLSSVTLSSAVNLELQLPSATDAAFEPATLRDTLHLRIVCVSVCIWTVITENAIVVMVVVVVVTGLLPLSHSPYFGAINLSSANCFASFQSLCHFLPAALEHRQAQCYLLLLLIIMTISHYIIAFEVFFSFAGFLISSLCRWFSPILSFFYFFLSFFSSSSFYWFYCLLHSGTASRCFV